MKHIFLPTSAYLKSWRGQLKEQTDLIFHMARPAGFHGNIKSLIVRALHKELSAPMDGTKSLTRVMATLRDYFYLVSAVLFSQTDIRKPRQTELTELIRRMFQDTPLRGTLPSSTVVANTAAGLGMSLDEMASFTTLMLTSPDIPKAEWFLTDRADAAVEKIRQDWIEDTKLKLNEIDSLTGQASSLNDDMIDPVVDSAIDLGDTVRAQWFLSVITSDDYLTQFFPGTFEGLFLANRTTMIDMARTISGFSSFCHIMTALSPQINAKLYLRQLDTFRALTGVSEMTKNVQADLDDFVSILNQRDYGIGESVLDNLFSWCSSTHYDAVLFSDVFNALELGSSLTRVRPLIEEELLPTESLAGIDDTVLGSVQPEFRTLYIPQPVELASVMNDSKKILQTLNRFYEIIESLTSESIMLDQIYLTDEQRTRMNMGSQSSLFSPVASMVTLAHLDVPNSYGMYEGFNNSAPGIRLARKDRRRLTLSLRTRIVDPYKLRELLLPLEVTTVMHPRILEYNRSREHNHGYSSVRGLLPADLGDGDYIQLSAHGSNEGELDHVELSSEAKRDAVLMLIGQILPHNPTTFLLNLDDQPTMYKTEIDALSGGIILSLDEGRAEESPATTLSESKVIEGRLKPYGLSYQILWDACTDAEDTIRLTSNIVCRPIVRVPKPSGRFSYQDHGPAFKLLTSLPETSDSGKMTMIEVRKRYFVTPSPFTSISTTKHDPVRTMIDEVQDLTSVRRLLRPIMWAIESKPSDGASMFIVEREWPGRKTSIGTPYFVIPNPFSSESPVESARDEDLPSEQYAKRIHAAIAKAEDEKSKLDQEKETALESARSDVDVTEGVATEAETSSDLQDLEPNEEDSDEV